VLPLVAESEGALLGQITFLPVARAPHPIDDSSLAHISNLFVRRDYWGCGLAADLHRAAVEAAGGGGFTELRLFVWPPARHARGASMRARAGCRSASRLTIHERVSR
jgi:GNAT superfamily N-acetyltransferase